RRGHRTGDAARLRRRLQRAHPAHRPDVLHVHRLVPTAAAAHGFLSEVVAHHRHRGSTGHVVRSRAVHLPDLRNFRNPSVTLSINSETRIDLTSDLGENVPGRVVSDDAAMLGLVTSANVSCGFHAGNPEGIHATVDAAVKGGVVIGAHPGYDDYEGF